MSYLYEFEIPCHFGMEAVLKREIQDLGYDIHRVDNGRVIFRGSVSAAARANIFLRTAERVLLCIGRFKAESFEELFEKTRALPWADFIPEDARFWVVKASTAKSKLFSSSDIQSIVKKAIVEKLKVTYKKEWFSEDGDSYPLRVFIFNDEVSICLDTTGDSLHKRGYRKLTGKAPVSETLAAAIIMLTPWKSDRILVDPFCGSGTFPIEAAMIGANIAPGMNRSFTSEAWKNIIEKKHWYEAVSEAGDLIKEDVKMNIQGYDIDPAAVKNAMANARLAGVEEHIHLQQRPASEFHSQKKYGFVICNPPYGERLEEKSELFALYKDIGRMMKEMDTWSYYILTGYEDAQRYIGRRADRNRKLYNGMIKTYFYQFMGPKPPKTNRTA